MIKLKNVSKYYYSKGVVATGFSKVNLELNIGEFVAITGESGSGKSTLLNVISGLDTYEEGEMYINGEETSHYIEKDFEEYRRKNIGNIYQNFNLINSYTVYQNIALVLMLNGEKNIKPRVLDLIKQVDLLKFKNTKVSKLSGGQKQRVAIARALAKDVPIIIADEPTGNLDKRSAQSIMKLLSELSKDKLVIVVTHNYDQVEPYVTRRIVMHDGRILEDNKIKKEEKVEEIKTPKIKNISFFNRIRLGFRNTFNVIPKFILLFLVFSFVTGSLMCEYAMFKKEEHLAKTEGDNYIFSDSRAERIVINKKDKASFSKEELEKIRKIKNVKTVIENDLLLDSDKNLSTEESDIWLYTKVYPIESFDKKLDYGRMPENENEIVIETMKDDYYLSHQREETMQKNFVFIDSNTGIPESTSPKLKIVGVKYRDSYNYQENIYVHQSVLDNIKNSINKSYSNIYITFQGKNYQSTEWNQMYKVIPSAWINMGEAYIPESINHLCPNNNCINSNITIKAENIYYSDSKNFRVSKTYNKDNIASIVETTNYNKDLFYEQYDGAIYINVDEYNSYFNKDPYQISVFVDDVDKINDTVKELDKMNLNTLKIMDTYQKSGIDKIMQIMKTIVTIVVVIILFFISYFIIKIIIKSRNTYYSIIRMLGGSSKVTKSLLIIELLVVATLAYILFIVLEFMNLKGIINVGIISDVYTYFTLNDYIILYIIIAGMAFLSSVRYARKLFKDSVMVSYREEV